MEVKIKNYKKWDWGLFVFRVKVNFIKSNNLSKLKLLN